MAFTTTSALAVTFAWTAAPACWRITIGGTPYDIDVDALAAARMCLGRAPGGSLGTNGAIDFVRHVEAAINTAVAASTRVFTLTWGTDDRLVLAVDTGTFTLAHLTTAGLLLSRVLGWISTGSGISSRTAVDPPWYLATFVALSGGLWLPRQAGAAARDVAGRTFSFGSSTPHHERTVTASLIPLSPEVCESTACHATPLNPAPAYLHAIGATDTQRRWAITDVVAAARNTTCALTLHRWQDLAAGASEDVDYFEGYLGEGDLLHETEAQRRDPLWEAFAASQFTFLLPGIGEAVTANRG